VSNRAYIRLYRAGPMIIDNFYFVSIDGVRVGEIWPRHPKVFEVTPDSHEVRVRPAFAFLWSRTVRVSVSDGQVVELACWPNWALGAYSLHKATARESERMRQIGAAPVPPRDLGSSDPGDPKSDP